MGMPLSMQDALVLHKHWGRLAFWGPFAPYFLGFLTLCLIFLALIMGDACFLRPSREILPSKMEVIQREMRAEVFSIDRGRSRIFVEKVLDEPLFIAFDGCVGAHFLMIRKGYDIRGGEAVSNLRVSVIGGGSTQLRGSPFSYTPREFVPTPQNQDKIIVKIESLDPSAAALVIDEIGFVSKFAVSKGKEKLFAKLTLIGLGGIAFLGVMAYLFLDKKKALNYGPLYFFILPIAIHFCLLAFAFSPDWKRDLRVNFASGPLQEFPGSNLNYGLHMASSVLQGKGPLICGMPCWCRMPGYGFVLALSGNAFDLLQMAVNSVVLQIVLFGLTLSFFFWSALRIMSVFVAALISTMISFLPFRFFYLQVESVMPAVLLFFAGAACLFIHKRKEASFRDHLLLHLSFALWFFLRTDILPAWALLSLFLYGRNRQNWKYFFIPIGLVFSIGISWALFKLPFTKEFSMTTHSVGASLMAGLWEIPHQFVWTPTDGSYFSWMNGADKDPTTKEGSDFALKEVIRFIWTYPFYLPCLIWHKFLLFAKSFAQFLDIKIFSWCRLWLLFVIFSSLLVKYKRFQTVLLSWIILFNVPVFFVFYSSDGRFYEAPNICLFIAALPLLFDREYYRKMYAEKLKFILGMFVVLIIIKFGFSLDKYLIHSHDFRYWSPFLDPKLSTLNVLRKLDE